MFDRRRLNQTILPLCLLTAAAIGWHIHSTPPAPASDPPVQESIDSSPVDFILNADESRAVTVNQTVNSISLVDMANGKILSEVPCGDRPCNVAISADERRVFATASYSGELITYALANDRLRQLGSLHLGFEPRGVAVSPDGKWAYVGLTTAGTVALIDLDKSQIVDRIEVGRWPRTLALSPDGTRLAVACSGDGGVAVIDTATRKKIYWDDFVGLNFGQMQVTKDGKHVYFPWIVYRQMPITQANIRRGWVLASRIARLPLDRQASREAIALDPEGRAVGDPHGVALSPDEKTLVCAASGTHELLVYRLGDLPFKDYGPGDHIDPALLKDREVFDRIPLGGRPMTVRYSRQGDVVYVANYLLNAIQVVDVANRKIVRTIPLNSSATPSLVRQGETIFYDAGRSFDQWYSCHSCHYEGHTNAGTIDTRNDGRFGNYKSVLSLRGSAETGPWFWHGNVNDFHSAIRQSLKDTMLGKPPTDDDVTAVAAYIKSLKFPPNPNRGTEELKSAIARGETVFHGAKGNCASCHPAPLFTDGKKHDVGLGSKSDAFQGYYPPSLRGIYDRIVYLHDGRSSTLEEVLRGPHNPAKVTGNGGLTDAELKDLLAYLKSL